MHGCVMQIKLKSSDDEIFEVAEDVAMQSLTLKNMVDGARPALRQESYDSARLLNGHMSHKFVLTCVDYTFTSR